MPVSSAGCRFGADEHPHRGCTGRTTHGDRKGWRGHCLGRWPPGDDDRVRGSLSMMPRKRTNLLGMGRVFSIRCSRTRDAGYLSTVRIGRAITRAEASGLTGVRAEDVSSAQPFNRSRMALPDCGEGRGSRHVALLPFFGGL